MRIPPIHARTRRLASRLLALLLAAAAPAAVHADTTTVQAVGTGPSAPIKSFEVSVETQVVRPAWLCQVVGPACIAGAIVVQADGPDTSMTVRHALTGAEIILRFSAAGALTVERGGVTVATFDPAVTYPGGGHANGFESLLPDPCWQMVRRAFSDGNLSTLLSTSSAIDAESCADGCALQYPLPALCTQPTDSPECCRAFADRLYCEDVCDCAGDPAGPEACELAARAVRAVRIANCTLNSIGID